MASSYGGLTLGRRVISRVERYPRTGIPLIRLVGSSLASWDGRGGRDIRSLGRMGTRQVGLHIRPVQRAQATAATPARAARQRVPSRPARAPVAAPARAAVQRL